MHTWHGKIRNFLFRYKAAAIICHSIVIGSGGPWDGRRFPCVNQITDQTAVRSISSYLRKPLLLHPSEMTAPQWFHVDQFTFNFCYSQNKRHFWSTFAHTDPSKRFLWFYSKSNNKLEFEVLNLRCSSMDFQVKGLKWKLLYWSLKCQHFIKLSLTVTEKSIDKEAVFTALLCN